MILDALLVLSDAQAITATAASTNVVDLGIARDIGTGSNLYVVFGVDVAFTDAGSDSTITATLEVDNDVAFGSVDNTQTIGVFGALSAIGARLIAKLQPLILDSRYIRAKYTTTGGNLTTGSISAFFTRDVEVFKAYAKGYTIN